MKVETVLFMNPDHGPNSYAHNSAHQQHVMLRAMPLVKERVRALYRKALFPDYLLVADLGCSSGPNSLLAVTEIVEAITGLCSQNGRSPPEVLVFLNDLPMNDFNSVFTNSLPCFYEKLKQKNKFHRNCFVSAMPGSFYGRLFPSRSLHFVHSSYSNHWLSQVPDLPEENKGNIYMASNSPLSVFQAYLKQFQRDFMNFLRSRAPEIVPGGEMFLTFIGRSITDPTSKDCCLFFWWLSRALIEMADEVWPGSQYPLQILMPMKMTFKSRVSIIGVSDQGLIEYTDIDSCDLPFYTPYKDEVRDAIEEEGSFTINSLETFEVNWDPFYHEDDESCTFDKLKSGQNVAGCIRSVTEPLLRSHFGEGLLMDDLFERYARLVGEHLSMEKTKFFNLAISMTRK